MAERAREKGKRAAARRRNGAVGASTQPADHYSQRIKSLERERDRLKAELTEARERISRLEASRTEVVNRIDWVIDSLHNVLETGA
jgi:uncharacterized coiled-coil DUF342 family protein